MATQHITRDEMNLHGSDSFFLALLILLRVCCISSQQHDLAVYGTVSRIKRESDSCFFDNQKMLDCKMNQSQKNVCERFTCKSIIQQQITDKNELKNFLMDQCQFEPSNACEEDSIQPCMCNYKKSFVWNTVAGSCKRAGKEKCEFYKSTTTSTTTISSTTTLSSTKATTVEAPTKTTSSTSPTPTTQSPTTTSQFPTTTSTESATTFQSPTTTPQFPTTKSTESPTTFRSPATTSTRSPTTTSQFSTTTTTSHSPTTTTQSPTTTSQSRTTTKTQSQPSPITTTTKTTAAPTTTTSPPAVTFTTVETSPSITTPSLTTVTPLATITQTVTMPSPTSRTTTLSNTSTGICRKDEILKICDCENACNPKTFDLCYNDGKKPRCICKPPLVRYENDSSCITKLECKKILDIHNSLTVFYPQKYPCPPGETFGCVFQRGDVDQNLIEPCEWSCDDYLKSNGQNLPQLICPNSKRCLAMGCRCAVGRARYYQGQCVNHNECTTQVVVNDGFQNSADQSWFDWKEDF